MGSISFHFIPKIRKWDPSFFHFKPFATFSTLWGSFLQHFQMICSCTCVHCCIICGMAHHYNPYTDYDQTLVGESTNMTHFVFLCWRLTQTFCYNTHKTEFAIIQKRIKCGNMKAAARNIQTNKQRMFSGKSGEPPSKVDICN